MATYGRYDGFVITPIGNAVPGASIAVLTQPANFTSQPGSPLAAIHSAANSNTASIASASWSGGQITFTFSATPPADVVADSLIAVAGATPSGYNSTAQSPWVVLSVSGNNVIVAALNNPGPYVSSGSVITSVLPNPTFSDGNGNFFFYALPGEYSLQMYSDTVEERDVTDQLVLLQGAGAGSVTSVGLSLPSPLSVTVSPITTAGTLTAVWATQSAGAVFAGPTAGSPSTPGFRALVAGDIPSLPYASSVGLAVTVPAFLTVAVTGSPVTSAGTLSAAIGLVTQAANTAFLGPTAGAASQPTFRSLIIADLPFTGSPGATTFACGDGTWKVVSGGTGNWMNGVTPTGSRPGSTFTLPHTPNGTVTQLFKSGQELGNGTDYTISGTTITTTVAVGTTDTLRFYGTY